MSNPPGIYDVIDLQARVDGRYPRIIDDLVTIIDFCDAMAQRYLSVLRGGTRYMSAIRQAHDIAHVLEGGDKVLSWHTVAGLCGAEQIGQSGFGPAWPDVRARMADVLARAEEMTR